MGTDPAHNHDRCLLTYITQVFKLQMPMTKKISVMGCFFLGGL
jgi:hypothetical protein